MRTGQWSALAAALTITCGCGGWSGMSAGGGETGGAAGMSPAEQDSGGFAGGGGPIDSADGATEDALMTPADGGALLVRPAPLGLHVVLDPSPPHLEDAEGKTIVLRGVNRSGTEYRCVQNNSMIFDGPFDEISVQAIASWKATAVRVPLNEACWLGLTANGASAANSGDVYKDAIRGYVALLQKYGLVPILDLHWVGPGASRADRLQPMPDADHAVDFWADVAATFKDNSGVVFEPFNEPFPASNSNTTAAWECWRDGCVANQAVPADAGAMTYQATGMQSLVTAIRSAGATNLVLLGGVQYSNGLSQWLAYKPADPLNNIAAAWHVYNFNPCVTESCWAGVPATVAAAVPIVATEIGENDCGGTFITRLMQWLDARGAGYLAWSWNAFGPCRPGAATGQGGRPWSLVIDYTSGAPNVAIPDAGVVGPTYAKTFHDHLLGL